jgi:hypothetical protein
MYNDKLFKNLIYKNKEFIILEFSMIIEINILWKKMKVLKLY